MRKIGCCKLLLIKTHPHLKSANSHDLNSAPPPTTTNNNIRRAADLEISFPPMGSPIGSPVGSDLGNIPTMQQSTCHVQTNMHNPNLPYKAPPFYHPHGSIPVGNHSLHSYRGPPPLLLLHGIKMEV